MLKHKLVDFIIQFMEEVDKEISEMKLFVRPFQMFLETHIISPKFPQLRLEINANIVVVKCKS